MNTEVRYGWEKLRMLDVNFRTQSIENVYNYWLSKCSPNKLPGRRDIDPAEMVSFLPHLILMDVQPDPLDFKYRLIGTHVVSHMKQDHTGKWMSQLDHQKSPSTIWDSCHTVVETAKPVYPHTPYIGPKKDIVEVEDIILPLAQDGVSVDMLLIAVSFLRKSHSGLL